MVVVALVCARPFLLLSFDPEQADVAGFPSRRYHAIMLLLVALTVVVSFQTVGTLLVFGMLLAPAGTGALLARRVSTMMLIACVVGIASSYLGLLASYWCGHRGGRRDGARRDASSSSRCSCSSSWRDAAVGRREPRPSRPSSDA